MKTMPIDKGLDNTLVLLKEGYPYILNRRKSFDSDVFETRLLGKKAICMGGEEAAELFYDNDKFKRENAAPNRALKTLFGQGGVQTLDQKPHMHRKELFMSLMSKEGLQVLNDLAKEQWDLAIGKWSEMDEVVLYEEAQEILCRTACIWAGVPVREKEFSRLSKSLGALYESAAEVGPGHWAGRNARNTIEKWMQGLVENVRKGQLKAPEKTAMYQFSWHRDVDGDLLKSEIVAVELLNILRPIVAISVYINFVALAIHDFPNEKKHLQDGDENYAKMFIQEVRRYYPFFPFAAARVKQDFEWRGYHFEKNTLTLLDLYGTNHDSNIWAHPDTFQPERFKDWKESPFNFIPQGGGEFVMGHRCAGEWVTIDMMKISVDYLVNQMDYEVLKQNLSYSMTDMPSMPKDKMVIKHVRRK